MPVAKKFTLGKNERLKSRKSIEELFTSGKSFHIGPYRVHYQIKKEESNKTSTLLQFGVGVSGKYFKKAVDRNRIKRLTKEAYRQQKLFLQDQLKEKNLPLHVFFIYTEKELPVFQHITEKVAIALKKLAKLINENSTPDS